MYAIRQGEKTMRYENYIKLPQELKDEYNYKFKDSKPSIFDINMTFPFLMIISGATISTLLLNLDLPKLDAIELFTMTFKFSFIYVAFLLLLNIIAFTIYQIQYNKWLTEKVHPRIKFEGVIKK